MSFPCQVSVVVPILSEHRYSPESLESVATQTGPSCEIIIVDGGASSELVSRLREQTRSFTVPVRWIRDHRGEMPVLRNRGILESRAPFVAFHNYRDRMAPARLEEGIRLLGSRCDLVLVSSPSEHEGERQDPERKSGTPEGRTLRHRARIWDQSEQMLGDLLARVLPGKGRGGYHIPDAATMMVRRTAALAAGLYDTRFTVTPWATLEFSLRLYEQGDFGRIGTPLVLTMSGSRVAPSSAWTRSMEQMDLFYLILAWRYGSTKNREAERILKNIREHWLRHWSGWFFRYREGRKAGIRLAMRALASNLFSRENWTWAIKSLLPHSQYPRLFWFERFIDAPVPPHCQDPELERILARDWRLS